MALRDGGSHRRDGKAWSRQLKKHKGNLRKDDKIKEKERSNLRNCDPSWGNQKRIWDDSNLIVNWMNGKWKINQRFRKMIQRTQNMLDKVGFETNG